MSRYGVQPNMLILPPCADRIEPPPRPDAWLPAFTSCPCVRRQMLLYMALAPEQKLTCAIILNPNLATGG